MQKSNAEKRWEQLAIFVADQFLYYSRKKTENDIFQSAWADNKSIVLKNVLDKMAEIEKEYPVSDNSNGMVDNDWIPEDIYGSSDNVE